MKGIYVKTNSPDKGFNKTEPGSGGEITNIHYENIEIHNPLWWGIYIGPQQQKQPGGGGDGCMFYPIGGCQTQPLIHMSNVTLKDIRQHGGILPPGIVRCNSTLPCTGFVFDNVQASGWWSMLGLGYITENIFGTVTNSKPTPAFGTDDVVIGQNFVNSIIAQISEKLGKLAFEHITRVYFGKKIENQAK